MREDRLLLRLLARQLQRFFGVVAAPHLFVDLAQPTQRLRIRLPEHVDGPRQRDACAVEIAAQLQGASQQRQRFGIDRSTDRRRLAQLAHRFVEPPLTQIDRAQPTAQLAAHGLVGRATFERRAINLDGVLQLAAPPVQLGQRQARLGKIFARGDGPPQRLGRLRLFTTPSVRQPQQILRARVIRAQHSDARQLLQRRIVIAPLEVPRSQLDVRAHVVGNDQVAELVGEPVKSVENAHNRSRSAARRPSTALSASN